MFTIERPVFAYINIMQTHPWENCSAPTPPQAGNYATQKTVTHGGNLRGGGGASGASVKMAALMGTDPVTGKAWRTCDHQINKESLSESPLTCPLCGFFAFVIATPRAGAHESPLCSDAWRR